ncbi:MAG TPA: transporter substrate-binding domain-containing protein [Acidimicrobiia bacterium]|jgi:polar amino acid transport system substrate-binding protein|nr:transporter substrate-binding domain-containing protein [Acidimicrobiia bacterium]
MKSLKTIALLLTLVLALAACGDDGGTTDDTGTTGTDGSDGATTELETITPGTLTVCTDAPYPPMEYEDPDTGEFTGFDIELLRAVAGNLGLDLAVVNVGFDPITSGLAMEAGDCDIAAASITITPERAENIAFTDGYFSADQSLLVLADSGIETLEDLSGQSIAVQTGTTGAEYAEENAPEDAEIVSFENPGDVFLALESGQVQGVLQDIVPNQDYANSNESAVVVETYETDEEYGFAAALEGTEDLIAAVNEQLEALRSDGTYDEIYQQFFPEN